MTWDLLHNGVKRGEVTKVNEDGSMEMDIHLDTKTGELLEKAHEIRKVMGSYHIILKE